MTLLLLLICQQARVDAQTVPPQWVAFDQRVQQDARGYEWLRWSVGAIGHRLTGSAQGAQAERAADSLFRLSGLETVRLFPFEAQAWSRGRVQLTVGDGMGFLHLQAVALANTPLEADVEAPLVDAGNGLPADLDRVGEALKGPAWPGEHRAGGRSRGHARTCTAAKRPRLALTRGVAAIVFVNQVDGGVLLTGTASIDGTLIPVPAACIATEDGTDLALSFGSRGSS